MVKRPEWARKIKVSTESIVVYALVAGGIMLAATTMFRAEEKDHAIEKANSVADPILQLCSQSGEASRALATARTPDGKSLCNAAAEVKTDPVTAKAVLPNLDEARVIELVRAELARHPHPEAVEPSMAQLIEAARAVISENPDQFRGEPGGLPSPTEIAAVVSLYVNANPEQFRGPRGAQGEPGPPGDNGEPGRAGRIGPKGDKGDSFGGIRFVSRDGDCFAVVTIVSGSTSRESSQEVPMTLCQPPPTVTVTPTPPPASSSTPPPPDTDG